MGSECNGLITGIQVAVSLLVADGIGRRFALMLELLYLAEKIVDLLHKSKEPLRVLLFPGERA